MKAILKKTAFAIVAFILVVALVEGLASLGMFAYDVLARSERTVPARRYTRHDPELGWVNVPDTRVESLFGPGRHVTINRQGFRGTADVADRVPAGKVRVVCSGDSFTFGYGVGDDETWVAMLPRLDERLETVNLGQGGYGIDQAYLWYRRDGERLEHQIHLFAVIVEDFNRMQFDTFMGYGKPVLKVENGTLAPDGVPVGRSAFLWPWLTQNSDLFRSLRMVSLAQRIVKPKGPAARMSFAEAIDLAIEAMKTLLRIDRERNRVLVFVFLPTPADVAHRELNPIRQEFLEKLRRSGVRAIDLVGDFQALPPATVSTLFIRKEDLDFPGAAGHYTPAGNELVARRLLERLLEFPEVARRLPPK